MENNLYPFRSTYSKGLCEQKYNHDGIHKDWRALVTTLVHDVCEDYISGEDKREIVEMFYHMKALPGGRYLYYAGRELQAYNNCFLLKAEEDTRQDWARIGWQAESCLMLGGGIGIDYSVYRRRNSVLKRTGGFASGPIPKMKMINETGRQVEQGGSRRSAMYASLNWQHGDIHEFLTSKNWYDMPVTGTQYSIGDLKELDFNYPAPLDMTNISVNYDTDWIRQYHSTGDVGDVFRINALQALKTSEPGFSFNFYDKEKETLRNA